jgi:hypothetical protein
MLAAIKKRRMKLCARNRRKERTKFTGRTLSNTESEYINGIVQEVADLLGIRKNTISDRFAKATRRLGRAIDPNTTPAEEIEQAGRDYLTAVSRIQARPSIRSRRSWSSA